MYERSTREQVWDDILNHPLVQEKDAHERAELTREMDEMDVQQLGAKLEELNSQPG